MFIRRLAPLVLLAAVPGQTPECDDPTPTPVPTPTPAAVRAVCYAGADRAGQTCVEVIVPETLPSEYLYPEPLDGDPQYTAPDAFLDLVALPEDLAVAPNFVLSELASASKGPYAVIQSAAVWHLQEVRDELGPLIVTSGYRSPAYNASVGGVTWSRHIYGDGFDLYASQASLAELADSCERSDAAYVGVYTDHIHCDWRYDPLDPAFYSEPLGAVARHRPVGLDATLTWDGEAFTAPATGWDEGEPLRTWRAFDGDGHLLAEVDAARFVPPAGTTRVSVEVGLALVREATLR